MCRWPWRRRVGQPRKHTLIVDTIFRSAFNALSRLFVCWLDGKLWPQPWLLLLLLLLLLCLLFRADGVEGFSVLRRCCCVRLALALCVGANDFASQLLIRSWFSCSLPSVVELACCLAFLLVDFWEFRLAIERVKCVEELWKLIKRYFALTYSFDIPLIIVV